MTLFVIRRLGLLVGALFLSSIVIFVLLHLLPGDVARVLGGTEASPERIEALRAELGLDRSFLEQYTDWIGGILHGDFGRSLLNNKSVLDELTSKLTVTAPLVLFSSALAAVVAVPLGFVAAARHRRVDGVALNVASQLGIAVPSFFVGLLLVLVVSVKWDLLPAQGFPTDGWDDPAEALRALALPVITLAISQGAVLFRFVRSAALDVIGQDYMRTARAKGLTRSQALVRHGLRNASVPIVSILGVQIASLIAGVLVIERVFQLPGVGQMLVTDVGTRDLGKVQGTVLLIAVIVLVIGFVVDIVHGLIDPRLRAVG